MNILCIIPPYVPSYFNAGHHLPVFQVGNYIRANFPSANVKCIDAAALNLTWKEICNLLIKDIHLIVLMNDFDGIDTFQRFMKYKEVFCPKAKVITFGRLSKQIPRFFFQFNIDAIAVDGDYESAVSSYITHLENPANELRGVLLLGNDSYNKGIVLESDDWILPDVNEIPYDSYNFMYKNDLNKFCGIPQRQELVVPLARGCPFGCEFCDVHVMQGKTERRLSVSRTISYITDSFKQQPFEYLTFYCPTFTLNHKWVLEFCENIKETGKNYPWKCITVLKCLNEQLVKVMAESGCIRISLGIESFTRAAAMGLPKCKQDILDQFINMVNICNNHGVELNCFIILGLPGDTPADVQMTIETCLKYGARIRPTIYTPYNLLKEDMTIAQVGEFNRQFFPECYLKDNEAIKYYKLFYDLESDKPTSVMNNIPVNQNSKASTLSLV